MKLQFTLLLAFSFALIACQSSQDSVETEYSVLDALEGCEKISSNESDLIAQYDELKDIEIVKIHKPDEDGIAYYERTKLKLWRNGDSASLGFLMVEMMENGAPEMWSSPKSDDNKPLFFLRSDCFFSKLNADSKLKDHMKNVYGGSL